MAGQIHPIQNFAVLQARDIGQQGVEILGLAADAHNPFTHIRLDRQQRDFLFAGRFHRLEQGIPRQGQLLQNLVCLGISCCKADASSGNAA